MADNIGTITVAIEAQTEDLKQGLASAEKMVKDSAQKMEQATEGLAEKAEKSWTEFASKLGVIQQVAQIAQQAVKALAESMIILGDDSKSSGDKYNAILNTIRDSGIPVLSQAVSIGQSLRDVFDGTARELAELNAEMLAFESRQAWAENMLAMANYSDSLKTILSDERTRTGLLEDSGKMNRNFARVYELQAPMMRRRFEEELAGMKGVRGERTEDFERRKQEARDLHEEIIEQMFEQARIQDEKVNKTWWEGVLAKRKRIADEIAREEQLEIDKAIRVANKTLSLEEQLAIMVAKQEGDEEKARILAIEARYRAMSVGATKAQQESIDAMKAIELAGISATGGGGDGGGMGGTASISTAVGGFTVASGAMERKKQTSLLKVIATGVTAMSQATARDGIIPATG